MEQQEFERQFEGLTGFMPMPWQTRLYRELSPADSPGPH